MDKVWVLTDESPHDNPESGYSCMGVFASKEAAWDYLSEYVLDEGEAERIIWSQSPDNPGYFEGRSEGERLLLVEHEVSQSRIGQQAMRPLG